MKPERTRIKICGITDAADGTEAARLGVDYLGFIFYPPSPRWIEPKDAARVLAEIREVYPSVQAIGVFVDETPERLDAVREIVGLDGVQFSGDESPEVVAQAAPLRFRGLSIETLDRLGRYDAEAYLCDTHAPDVKGGTGRTYDYEILRPHIAVYPLIVAGGLTPESVGSVVEVLEPWGVDVSSALETAPGRKDHARMMAFIDAVRRGDLRRGVQPCTPE